MALHRSRPSARRALLPAVVASAILLAAAGGIAVAVGPATAAGATWRPDAVTTDAPGAASSFEAPNDVRYTHSGALLVADFAGNGVLRRDPRRNVVGRRAVRDRRPRDVEPVGADGDRPGHGPRGRGRTSDRGGARRAERRAALPGARRPRGQRTRVGRDDALRRRPGERLAVGHGHGHGHGRRTVVLRRRSLGRPVRCRGVARRQHTDRVGPVDRHRVAGRSCNGSRLVARQPR